jgi:hypothetical protein
MKKTLLWMAVAALAVCVAPRVLAEEPAGAPEPTPQHEALQIWIGTWSGNGTMKETPMGPGGPMEWTEECSWFGGGRFHVICKSEGTSPTGPMKGIGIIGYDAEKGVYTHYGVDNNGWAELSQGKHEGDDWTFTSKSSMGGQTYHSRFTMTMQSPKSMTFNWQTSPDGKAWDTLMEGTSKKM